MIAPKPAKATMDTRPTPATVSAFLQQLALEREELPARLRQCAEYVLANSDRIAFATVANFAAGAGVQPSALIRFCQYMGFSGFSDMQSMFRTQIQPGLSSYSARIENLKSQGAGTPSAILAEFVDSGMASLDQLSLTVDNNSLNQSVKALSEANLLHIVGFRRAFPVASYLTYAFEKLQVPAILHDGSGRIQHVHAIQPGDAMVAITFEPYTIDTVELAKSAADRGLTVVAITDSPKSPLNGDPFLTLRVSEIDYGAFRSLTASLALALSIAVSVGAYRSETGTADRT
jgi:DNA-binding MurR/RpiR family transcriptional regulator